MSDALIAVLLIAFILGVRGIWQWNKEQLAVERRREEAELAARRAEAEQKQRERDEAAAALYEQGQNMKHYFDSSRKKAIQDRLREIKERD